MDLSDETKLNFRWNEKCSNEESAKKLKKDSRDG